MTERRRGRDQPAGQPTTPPPRRHADRHAGRHADLQDDAHADPRRDPGLDVRPGGSAVLDSDGILVAVDDDWAQFCRENGGDLSRCGPGVSYLDICERATPDPYAAAAATAVRSALSGRLSAPITMPVPCPAPGTSGWFDLAISSRTDDTGLVVGAVVTFRERPGPPDLAPRSQWVARQASSGQVTGAAGASPEPVEPEPVDLAGLSFPDVPRMQLEDTLNQLTRNAEEVLRTQGRLRHLLRANAAVTADLRLDMVLRHVVEAARDLVGASYAALAVLQPDGSLDRFVHVGAHTTAAEPGFDHPDQPTDQPTAEELQDREDEDRAVGESLLALLAQGPEAVRLTSLTRIPEVAGFPEGHPATRSFLGLPIRVRGRFFGNLYLSGTEHGEFTDEDEQLLSSLVRTAAVAIENARLYEDSERRRRWQTATTEATQLVFAGNHGRPLEVVLSSAMASADADLGMFVHLEDEEHVVVEAAVGEIAHQVIGMQLTLEDSALSPVLVDSKPLLIDTYRRDRPPAHHLSPSLGSLIASPLATGPRSRGAMVICRRVGERSFDTTDCEQLEVFAGHAGVALELNQARADAESLAVLREHQRIAADLHDHVIQELFATGMGLQAMVLRLQDEAKKDQLLGFVDAIDGTIRRIRTTIFRLNRAPRGGGGLKAQLLAVVEDARPALGFTASAEFSGPLDQAVPEDVAEDVVAVAREALSNAARHAGADHVQLRVALVDGVLTVDAIDDGRGMADASDRSSGLANLRARATKHGGAFQVSAPPGGGTHLHWSAHL